MSRNASAAKNRNAFLLLVVIISLSFSKCYAFQTTVASFSQLQRRRCPYSLDPNALQKTRWKKTLWASVEETALTDNPDSSSASLSTNTTNTELESSSTRETNPGNNGEDDNNDDSEQNKNSFENVAFSIVLLNLVAIIWGSQHAVIKTVIDDTGDPGSFTLLRFGLAAALATPYAPGLEKLWKKNSEEQKDSETMLSNKTEGNDSSLTDDADFWTVWRWGLEMGFWMFLGFSFQAIGLEFTTAQRSGFLLYLNVKFVPFLGRVLLGRQISTATWISALAAFSGTALLAGGGGDGGDLNVGDLWSIAAAVASAMFILRLERASTVVKNSAALNATSLLVVATLAAIWTLSQQPNLELVPDNLLSMAISHPLEIAYLGGITTALANWIQTKAQRNVSAERASVIYAMDPVYGAAFSYFLLGETLNGLQGWVGAGLITLAAATNAFLDFSKKDQGGEEESSLEDAESSRR